MGTANSTPEPDLTLLFRDHAPGLAGAVRGILGARADVEEILQEAFLKAWSALSKGTRPADPVAWVFVITLNLARDRRRGERRRGPHLNLDEVDAVSLARERNDGATDEPSARLQADEELSLAQRAILRLEEKQKEVFLLRVSGELGFRAVADALSIPEGTAKSRMRAALRSLRASLSEGGSGGRAPGGLQ